MGHVCRRIDDGVNLAAGILLLRKQAGLCDIPFHHLPLLPVFFRKILLRIIKQCRPHPFLSAERLLGTRQTDDFSAQLLVP